MDYYCVKAIFASEKKTFKMQTPSESFYVAQEREKPYINPFFEKVVFDTEKPTVMLISAVGATGKSVLAQVLSNETGLPLLDLAKHKPVADNTLTGLLTSTFAVEDLSSIFEGIGKGGYGVIIDGIDEGRSKTTEKAFEAFLDDIVRLCNCAANTSFVLLGRTQILEDCWIYLTQKQLSTGLITISPFGADSARKYIDEFTGALEEPHAEKYEEVRDSILNMLGAAFGNGTKRANEDFLSFIGYPPVLDAIVTLLIKERNYHRLQREIQSSDTNDVEIKLLNRIAKYILRREKEEKVVPNILKPLVADMPGHEAGAIIAGVYETEEQCKRLVSHCLNRTLTLDLIPNHSMNEKYEEQLLSWLPEHPFISGREFRNAVFESLALATLIAAGDPESVQLVHDYLASHKYSYHLIYLLSTIATDGWVPMKCMHVVLGSALEFQSTNASVELCVDGPEPDDLQSETTANASVEIEIEILVGKDRNIKPRTFIFRSNMDSTESVHLGHRLSSTYVTVPCDVLLSGAQELELTAPIEISTRRIILQSKVLVLRRSQQSTPEEHVLFQGESVESTLERIVTNGVTLTFAVSDPSRLTYPCHQYAQEKEELPSDSSLRQKYLRLKRILMEFRSHGRGALARYKDKIEDERVLRNPMGHAVLQQLLTDRILTLEGNFYYLDSEGVSRHLGVCWHDLKKGQISDTLLRYLRAIPE